MSVDELQKRTCRCCNRSFEYPVPRSRTTRFHCAECAELAPGLRKVFEQMNRRVKRNEQAIEKLKKQLAERAKADAGPA